MLGVELEPCHSIGKVPASKKHCRPFVDTVQLFSKGFLIIETANSKLGFPTPVVQDITNIKQVSVMQVCTE